jgi:hypothetical protein
MVKAWMKKSFRSFVPSFLSYILRLFVYLVNNSVHDLMEMMGQPIAGLIGFMQISSMILYLATECYMFAPKHIWRNLQKPLTCRYGYIYICHLNA